MRLDLLGLDLDTARARLQAEGVCPHVRTTSAPNRHQETNGIWRVVAASDDELTVALFCDPLEEKLAGSSGD